MTEDDVEELLEKAQDLQTELNDLHQQRVSKSDNADEKLVMFRKQVNLANPYLICASLEFHYLRRNGIERSDFNSTVFIFKSPYKLTECMIEFIS